MSGSATVRDRNLSAALCNRSLLPATLATGLSLIDVCAVSPGLVQAAAAHLQVNGTSFRSASRPFEWRGISAFRLVEMVAHGREREAVAFLDWAHGQKLTVVRVFVMARNLFQLEAADGLAALPRVLELAQARSLHVEAVALIDTAEMKIDLDAHVKAIGGIAAKHTNALVEIANEPGHPTQDRRLHDPATVRRLAALVPDRVPVALGSAEYDDGYASGDYATYHFPRAPDPDGWGHVLALSRGAALVSQWRKPVVSDEPIGAGNALQPGRRDNDPRRFRAAAALTRLAALQPTFHYEGGLQARVPAGTELGCFTAWTNGLEIARPIPSCGRFLAQDGLASIVSVEGARAAFARECDGEAWALLIDPRPEASVTWRGAWRAHERVPAAGVHLLRARR